LRDETSEILGKIKENMKTSFRFQALRYEILNRLKKTKAAPTEMFDSAGISGEDLGV
jgi:hypothetical protein